MNCFKKPFVFLLLCFLFASCENNSSSTENICECAKPLMELNTQIQNLSSSGKQEEMQALFPKAGELQKQMIECCKKNLSDKLDKEALKKTLEGSCDLPDRLVEAVMNGI